MKLSDFKPYQNGNERHIALCFDRSDEKRVLPLIAELYKRGIRTWYCEGFTSDYQKEDERMERVSSSDVLVIVRSKESFSSRFIKSMALYFENVVKSMVFIDFDVDSSDLLSSGLKNEHKLLNGNDTLEKLVEDIIHSDGFVQDIFCEPFVPNTKAVKFAAISIIIAAGLIFACTYLFLKGYVVPAARFDTVSFFDKTTERAARYSISGDYKSALTEQSIAAVETLYFDRVPKSLTDLGKFPNLKTVIMPQCPTEIAEYVLSYGTELVLYGGSPK